MMQTIQSLRGMVEVDTLMCVDGRMHDGSNRMNPQITQILLSNSLQKTNCKGQDNDPNLAANLTKGSIKGKK